MKTTCSLSKVRYQIAKIGRLLISNPPSKILDLYSFISITLSDSHSPFPSPFPPIRLSILILVRFPLRFFDLLKFWLSDRRLRNVQNHCDTIEKEVAFMIFYSWLVFTFTATTFLLLLLLFWKPVWGKTCFHSEFWNNCSFQDMIRDIYGDEIERVGRCCPYKFRL